MGSNRKYLLLLLLGTAFWGISVPLAKNGIATVSPFVFLMYRFLIASLLLGVFFYKKLQHISFKDLKYGVLLSLPLVVALSLQTIALKYTSSSNAAFIAGIDVLMVPVLKMMLFKRKIHRNVWIAGIIALIGLAVIAVNGDFSLNFGDFLAFLGAIGFAIYIVIVGKLSYKNIDAGLSVTVQMTSCFVICLIVSMFVLPFDQLMLPFDLTLIKSILFAGVFGTAFMYCIQNIAQKYIDDEKIALTYLLEPVFATVAAYFVLSEDITYRTVLGGSLILIALIVAEYRSQEEALSSESSES